MDIRKLTYHQGEIDGANDFQHGECENLNHLAEVTNTSYAYGYEAGWKRERDKYEKQLMGEVSS